MIGSRLAGRWLVTLCLLASPVSAQPSDPRHVAEAFFRAIAAERWRTAAAFLDLDSFEAYRTQLLAAARDEPPGPRLTVEMIMRSDPDMPRAVAEYELRKFEKMRKDRGRWMNYEFARTNGSAELAALTRLEAAARWIEAQDLRYQMRLAREFSASSGCPDTLAAVAGGESPPNHILGVVVTDSIAYVMHVERETRAPSLDAHLLPPQTHPRASSTRMRNWFAIAAAVMQLHRINGNWLIFAGHGLLNNSIGVTAVCEPKPNAAAGAMVERGAWVQLACGRFPMTSQ